MKQCAAALGVKRSELRIAVPHELVPLCGFQHGGIGPVGWAAASYKILLDDELFAQPEVGVDAEETAVPLLYGAGQPGLIFPVTARTLMERFGATTAPISVSTEGGCGE